jgi:hypothetical protein
MTPFAFMIGKCTWIPVSPKAAIAFLAYFYGIDPGVIPQTYENTIIEQIIAAGSTEEQATKTMTWLDQCMREAYE